MAELFILILKIVASGFLLMLFALIPIMAIYMFVFISVRHVYDDPNQPRTFSEKWKLFCDDWK